MSISVFETTKKFINNNKYDFSKTLIYSLSLYISKYLEISYDRIKNEDYYDPLTNHFITFDIGVNRVLWVLKNTQRTINNPSFFSYDMYLLLNCLNSLGGKKKGFNLNFFWSLLDLVKEIKKEEEVYFDKSIMLYIDFFINIIIGKRDEIWDMHVLQFYKNNQINDKLKRIIDFSSLEKRVFKFFDFHNNSKFTLISIDHKSKWIKECIEDLSSFKRKKVNSKVFVECIKSIEEKMGIVISVGQKEFFKKLICKPFLVQGIAGTGKSFLLCCLAMYFAKLKKNSRCVLLSFTGKAVSVLNTKLKYLGIYSKNIEAKTIHGELARLNNTNVKKETIYLIDESTFISTDLMYELLSRTSSKFITLFGDPNQLPPIELGNPFVSIIKAKRRIIDLVSLDTCYRESVNNKELITFKESILNNNRKQINRLIHSNSESTAYIKILGNQQDANTIVTSKCYDYSQYHTNTIDEINNYTIKKKNEAFFDLNNSKVFLVATNALRKYLNAIIHKDILKTNKNSIAFLPISRFEEDSFFNSKSGLPITIGSRLIYRGSNRYRNKKIYIANGETCIVTNIDSKKNKNSWNVKVTLLFNEFKKQIYSFSYSFKKREKETIIVFKAKEINILSCFILAYVLTIHNSQGSEYEEVVTIFDFKDSNMSSWGNRVGRNSFYSKNLIYTAISRAREKSTLIVPSKEFLFECLSKENDSSNNYMDYLLTTSF